MTRSALNRSDPEALDRSCEAAIEREIEARVAARCTSEAFLWKLRLIMLETGMMGALVIAAGLALDKPLMMVIRAALLVAGSCLASGLLLLTLSGACLRLRTYVRGHIGTWWAS